MSVPTYDPELAGLAQSPPSTDEWLHEIKLNGHRMSCTIIQGRHSRLVDRHGRDWSESLPSVRDAATSTRLSTALLDGEVAVLLPNGLTSSEQIERHSALPRGAKLAYFVYDLLHLDGEDTARLGIEKRKALLEELLSPTGGVIRYLPHKVGNGPARLAGARASGLAGIVSKRRDSLHTPGRSRNWLTSLSGSVEPLVIGGYTEHGDRVDGVFVGYYDPDGELQYAGNVCVGKGFDHEFSQLLRSLFLPLKQQRSPFTNFKPRTVRPPWGRGRTAPARWVTPLLVADISFAEWTANAHLRFPSFRKLRTDLAASSVVHNPTSTKSKSRGLVAT